MDTTDSLSEEILRNALGSARFGKTVYYFPAIGSTNDFARELASGGAAEGAVVVSGEQIRGRGRQGRRWISAPGAGIYLSIILRPGLPPANATGITLLAAVATARAIDTVTGLRPGIKWPNDILIGGKKICGILTEAGSDRAGEKYLILGIGVNVNNDEFPPEIRKSASSLKMRLGRAVSRKKLIVEIIHRIEESYPDFSARGDLSKIIVVYRRFSVTLGQQVRVEGYRGGFQGRALDVAADGSLLVKKENGEVTAVRSGEITPLIFSSKK
ncbi:MAG: biotin--[acetyl-CoA-carboxylase] ligase [PVC group bacterium]